MVDHASSRGGRTPRTARPSGFATRDDKPTKTCVEKLHHTLQSVLVGALDPHGFGSQRDVVSSSGPSNCHARARGATGGPIHGRSAGSS